jgi:hypothetical protein
VIGNFPEFKGNYAMTYRRLATAYLMRYAVVPGLFTTEDASEEETTDLLKAYLHQVPLAPSLEEFG